MRIKLLISGILGIGLMAALMLAPAMLTGVARESDKRLQEMTGMEASDFKYQWENFLPPNEAQVKTLLEGGKAQAKSGGQILITDAKLKTFSTNGVLELLAETPTCVLDAVQRTVSSASPLQVRSTDGKFFLEGEGFFLQQTNSLLIVSNRVHTVLRFEPGKAPIP